MSFEEFQDGYHGSHLLAILNLYNAPMPPIKFWLNLTYGLEGEASFEEFQDGHYGSHLRYQKGTISAILNLCPRDAAHQVLAQSDLWFGSRCCLKNFKMAAVAALLDIRKEQF